MSHILIVDDTEVVRRSVRLALEPAGYTFSEAATGADALARATGRTPDLVVADVRMPGMDGYALARALRIRYPSLPVLLLTGDKSVDLESARESTGVVAVLRKPIHLAALRSAVDQAVEQRRAVAGGSATGMREGSPGE
jgi:two-component system capsular synthesis sensor histidine kinase RcsC